MKNNHHRMDTPKEGYVRVGTLRFAVRIIGAKNAYGHTRYLVTPKSGDGEAWVEKVEIAQPEKSKK